MLWQKTPHDPLSVSTRSGICLGLCLGRAHWQLGSHDYWQAPVHFMAFHLCETLQKAVSGHEMFLVTPCPASYHMPVQISMKPSSGTPEVHCDLEMISNVK